MGRPACCTLPEASCCPAVSARKFTYIKMGKKSNPTGRHKIRVTPCKAVMYDPCCGIPCPTSSDFIPCCDASGETRCDPCCPCGPCGPDPCGPCGVYGPYGPCNHRKQQIICFI